jgi:antitoxin (DNA-binding transcriptional repressor) of toxin-antitoxin stability system
MWWMPMTTLTPTKARSNLSDLLLRALKGEEIGILVHGKIVALRPVTVTATDYVSAEYGLAPDEWKAVSKKLHAKGKKNREAGKAKRFTGNIEDAL